MIGLNLNLYYIQFVDDADYVYMTDINKNTYYLIIALCFNTKINTNLIKL